MSPDWDYEHPYKGATGVAVKGFPRPLYPPDAKGYMASVDGSDVEGIKRTISRLGRWPWKPDTYDQAFNNAFSHGDGNVATSGVAGFQRQMNIDDSGYVGEKTFNALRCALVPDGLPNAGQHGMDARSVELINAAWNRFKGSEPPPEVVKSSAEARLAKAITQLGVKESPANSNRTIYCDWYGMTGPWCCIFVTWCDQLSGVPSKSFVKGSKYAYVPYLVNHGRLAVNGLAITSSPTPGCAVCFDWRRDGEYDHIGIVETPPDSKGYFQTIEGNTASSNSGDQSNGGGVYRRTRNRLWQNTVFIKVAE